MLISSTHRSFFAAAILMSASNAVSDEISFDYMQATFTSATVDLGASVDEVDGSGFGFLLSLSFTPTFAITLAVLETTFETFQGVDVDTSKTTTLGVTAHTAIASGTEIFANASVLKAEITATDDMGSNSDDDYGLATSIGLRHLVTDAFEIEFGASQVYVFDDVANSFKADARLYLRKRLSLGIGYITGDNVDSLSLNLRLDV